MNSEVNKNRSAGYAFLIERYQLNVIPNWHVSSVKQSGTLQKIEKDGRVESIYPLSYWPGESSGAHLEFALKYDGINLGILSVLFDTIPQKEIVDWINSKPKGKYVRRIWFLFEFLTEKKLPLSDVTTGNYIDVLDTDHYYTVSPGNRIQRQRVINNLLGNRHFCPIVRCTRKLSTLDERDLRARCEEVITAYSPELLRRALGYLYSKETKSSFEIEHIKPSVSRTEKFIGLLEIAEYKDFFEKPLLINLQNRIVDPRFQDSDYRANQNYVGQTVTFQKEIIHYISPKPEDLHELMDGLLYSHHTMKNSAVSAVIHASIIAYGFVFLHPFEDGNGRIHRFLIHNILYLRNMIPKGLMFPVSAAMLKRPALYDQSLEAFSKPLLNVLDYDLDEAGKMTVHDHSARWYRYIDMTAQAEILYDFVKLTIEEELVEELDFLARYDTTKRRIQETVDMPDRLIDLFIHCILQNNGSLSSRKKESHFDFLTDTELRGLEKAVREGYNINFKVPPDLPVPPSQ